MPRKNSSKTDDVRNWESSVQLTRPVVEGFKAMAAEDASPRTEVLQYAIRTFVARLVTKASSYSGKQRPWLAARTRSGRPRTVGGRAPSRKPESPAA